MAKRSIKTVLSNLRSLTYPGFLVLLGLGFALVPLAKGELFFYWDNAQQQYPQTVFLHKALSASEIPHWWSQVGYGFPAVSEGQASHYHPIHLFFTFIFPPSVAFMLEIGVYLAIAGVSTYFFLREFRLRRTACMVGGLCQMFGSFSVVFVRNVILHRSFCLLPLAIFMAERFVIRRRITYGLAASLVFGLQLLTGHPTFAIVTIVSTIVYILCRILQQSWHMKKSFQSTVQEIGYVMVEWGLAVILGFGIAAIQVIPTFFHIDQSIRQGGLNFEYAVNSLTADIKYLPQLFFPYVYNQGDWLEIPSSWGSYFNVVPNMGIYLGTLPVLFAFLSVWWYRRWSDPAWTLALCFLCAMGFALGSKTPLFPALWSLPGMGGMRYPCRFLLWASFCLSCLAGLGLHKIFIRSRLARVRVRYFIPFCFMAMCILVLAILFWEKRTVLAYSVPVAQDFNSGIITSLVLFVVAFCLAFGLLVMRSRYHSFLLILIVLFIFADLSIFRSRSGYAPAVSVKEVMEPPSIVKFLKTDNDQFRVTSLFTAERTLKNKNRDLFEFLQADTCTLWDIDSADVWCSLMLKRYYALHESLTWELLNSPNAGEKLAGFLGALNVKYVVAPQSVTLKCWEKVHETDRAATWKNPDFLPRAFLVGEIVPENIEVRNEWFHKATYKRLVNYYSSVLEWDTRVKDAQIVDNIMAKPINYRTTAIVASNKLPELLGFDPKSKVEVGPQQGDVMRFNVQSQIPGLLVISNNYYPGWTATVNGKTTQIYRTNYVGMGVLVPAGESKVVLQFTSPGFRLGVFVTFMSLGMLLGGLIVARRFKLTDLRDIAPRLVKRLTGSYKYDST